ncbi:MAG TPA: ABC transporter permease [Cyclobacteriaceae bacterium]|nr:ABC transporter permease [Cyclobacteriaceae bacterium]HRF35588.1 ABC transporter permease [Cyclobacteriaceae bacterium]
MLKNFFKTAWRNIVRHKTYSIINFIGLTCGLTLALLIFAYVRSELSYDKFHANSENLYRFCYTVPNGLKIASVPPPIAVTLKDYFPQVEDVARVYGRNVSISQEGQNTAFEETNVFFTDSAFTKMFTLEFVKGNPARALHDKYTVLINEEMATKYFGGKDPIGESLTFSGRAEFKVTGVVKNFPENSHLRFNMLATYDDMYELEDAQTEAVLRRNFEQNFVISHSYTYVLLKPGEDPSSINDKMDDFVKKYALPSRQIGQKFTLMSLTDLHLKSDFEGEPTPTNSLTNIYIFIAAGLLTLLIACINYINLSTAQSLTRIKEIGIRKILGSMKAQLIIQFLAESFLFCLIALLISYVAFELALPLLNQLTGKHLEFVTSVDSIMIATSLVLLLIITVLAGGYPAYFVTQFESVSALKGNSGQGNQFMRKTLVVVQLTIACALLSGSILIIRQLNYLQSRPLGFNREHVINIPLHSENMNGFFQQSDSTFRQRLQTFRDILETQSGVTHTALSSGSPGTGVIYRGTTPEGFTEEDNMLAANLAVDYDFLSTYGMELRAGRSFSRDFGTDLQEAFIVNETAVQEFKWGSPEEALGKTINREGKKGKVIGVVKDFNFASLTVPITALVASLDPNQFNTLSVKFENANVKDILQGIEKEWVALFPEKAFQYTFLTEQLNQQYANFRNFGRIIQSFSLIAILISCLGVYGLVLFVVQRKVKEIGVRKVLGATVPSILGLIYKDFAFLLLLGFAFAIPVSWYLLQQWLANFTYRIDIGILTYALSFILILLIVSLTISYQALRAAQVNPVKSLRSE